MKEPIESQWEQLDSWGMGIFDPSSVPRATEENESSGDPSRIQLLCERCWATLESWTAPACPTCGVFRPPQGWATLPYTFRDRFVFTQAIGRGGMGAVFLGYDERQGPDERTPLAIKVVPEASSERSRIAAKELFEREASAAAMLAQSTHFVRVVGHDLSDPAYLAMEHVSWPTLRDCSSLRESASASCAACR
jgi:hypothetical protein